MTNREWLNSLSNADYVKWLLNTMHKISLQYSQSELGMNEWLQAPFLDDWTNDLYGGYIVYELNEVKDNG